MPFQVFRRHQRKMLAILAILAMFGFVLADSLPRFLQNQPAGGAGEDRVVATLYGKRVYESDLQRLEVERRRSNYVLSQIDPFFPPEAFGPTTTNALVDAYILEHEAKEMGMPATPEIAKAWIFEQARQLYRFRKMQMPQLPEFDEELVAQRLESIYQQLFRNQLTDVDFLSQIANQIRITKAQELISPDLQTPLDAFKAYNDEQLRVDAKYVEFDVADALAKVEEPADLERQLQAFYEEHKEATPDPTQGRLGLRIPRRVKVEFITLGLNVIDALKEKIRAQPIAEEIRADDAFALQVAEAHAQDQAQQLQFEPNALPAFVFNDDSAGELTPPPSSFVDGYLAQQVDQRVEDLLRDEIETRLDPIKERMYEFADTLEDDGIEAKTGLEVDRESVPVLDSLLKENFEEVASTLGPAAYQTEGLSATKLGLTRLLADPTTARLLIGPDGISREWQNYLNLTGIDWSSFAVRRQAVELLQSTAGLDVPSLSSEAKPFGVDVFEREAPLFEPQEYTDPIGRRYLAWKTLDLPETTPAFEKMDKEVVVAQWKESKARELTREAAEAFAKQVRSESSAGSPADVLSQLAEKEGKTVQVLGQRVASDPLETYSPIAAGEEVRKALFALDLEGDQRALVAPDRSKTHYYALALATRKDRSLTSTAAADQVIDYTNALNNLTFYRSAAVRDSVVERTEKVMEYLRRKAGLPANWTPPEETQQRG